MYLFKRLDVNGRRETSPGDSKSWTGQCRIYRRRLPRRQECRSRATGAREARSHCLVSHGGNLNEIRSVQEASSFHDSILVANRGKSETAFLALHGNSIRSSVGLSSFPSASATSQLSFTPLYHCATFFRAELSGNMILGRNRPQCLPSRLENIVKNTEWYESKEIYCSDCWE